MANQPQFHLRVRSTNKEARIHLLAQRRTLIGSDPTCDLLLDDRGVSARHAIIEYADGEYLLTDLNSRNGTRLTNEPLRANIPTVLSPNDEISILSYRLTFEEHWEALTDEEELTVEAELTLALDPYPGELPPGVAPYSLSLLQHLPALYQPDVDAFVGKNWQEPTGDQHPATFLSRFLALFESVLLPIQWVIENFDFYLDPRTAPPEFLPWLEQWYGLPFVATLDIEQRRKLLLEAPTIFAAKGTSTGLVKVIELCTPCRAVIDDQTTPAHTFRVNLQPPPDEETLTVIKHLIVAFKPVHTAYQVIK